ncbi:hypothetical protein E2C01_031896 [Portunus trituberculatus]|uniref:Uncharacterized protein n=1 Tax=Portunus trituberculatus TaxID=210409 RepID=A0A5B7EU06_PORTR|nr:hypothetical protein [Portunus trituberculatus]
MVVPIQVHLWCNHLEPRYHGDMLVTLNHSTNGIASKQYVVGFKPTRGRLP